ncbi:TetR/AcrR family transcriptional regulator [Aeromicrobium sp. 50.2.37]|uniref:TetR/AcrR family transcriptional regulator n=1 Tax=Aeromicrobium sp. 50.2.37 TaxID=2969305 RepID=UPI0021501E21|nr:TetR/AcrR family transcriptional regulator [Aeromicrobium sp. 50.2.37]MCR4512630.1 TetR/AcrR family transcriptional regulator [Aeromicrobium sp. 50.2.37]
MARYDKQHKEATRARILETAGRRLKRDGVDGSGVATLMKDAGLTNGAFYAHFDSKDQLVAEVVASQLRAQHDRLDTLPPGKAGVLQLVTDYLSVEHRDNPALGCPSAALLDEIARGSNEAREALSAGVVAMIDDLAARVAGGSPVTSEGRVRALSAYAAMVGTIQLARALTDDDLSRELVAQGLANVVAMLGIDS